MTDNDTSDETAEEQDHYEPSRMERLESLAERESVSEETRRAARRVLRYYREQNDG